MPKTFRFSCDSCPYMTNSKYSFTRHTDSVHLKKKPCHCLFPGCNFATSTNSNLKQHTSIVHLKKKPFACWFDGCNYTASTSSQVKEHVSIHTKDKPFHCLFPGCNYAASRNSNLKQHTSFVHLKKKPFACWFDGCNYSTTSSSNLKEHVRIHTKDKPYICKECKYATGFYSALLKHMRTHSGEKPYACGLCPYVSTQSSNLNVHLNSKHNPNKAKMERYEVRKKKKEEQLHEAIIAKDFGVHARELVVSLACENLSDCPETYRRIDWVKYLKNGILVLLENDERQHGEREQSCEVSRMTKITEALRQGGNLCPVVWIRFNPDGFSVDQVRQKGPLKVAFDQRLAELGRVLDSIEGETLSDTTPYMRVTYLYYDRVGASIVPPNVSDYMEIYGDGAKAFENFIVSF